MHLVGYNVHLDKLFRACGLTLGELSKGKDFEGVDSYNFSDTVRPVQSNATLLGDFHLEKSEYADAIKLYTQALAELSKKKSDGQTENIISNLFSRAQCYTQLHKYQKALSDLDCILSINPLHRKAYTTRANVFLAIGNQQAAALDFMRLNELEATISCQRPSHLDIKAPPLPTAVNYHSVVNTSIMLLSISCTVVCVSIAIFR